MEALKLNHIFLVCRIIAPSLFFLFSTFLFVSSLIQSCTYLLCELYEMSNIFGASIAYASRYYCTNIMSQKWTDSFNWIFFLIVFIFWFCEKDFHCFKLKSTEPLNFITNVTMCGARRTLLRSRTYFLLHLCICSSFFKKKKRN